MDKKIVVLTDLLNLDYLQLLQDKFARITRMPLRLIDPNGTLLTEPSNMESAAGMLDTTDSRGARLALCEANRSTGKASVSLDQSTGLTMAAVPLFHEKHHLGSWILGPLYVEDESPRGTAESAVLMRVASRRDFEGVLDFFASLGQTIVQLSRSNMMMERTNTELVELTEKMDLTAQMLAKFTNSADVAIYVTDFFTGEILMANETYAEFAGLSTDELLGQPCWKVMNERAHSFCALCPHQKLLTANGEPAPPVVWENYLPQRDMWIRMTNQAAYWVDGRLAHMVTFVDITQAKQIQEQLAQLAFYDSDLQLPNGLKLTHDLFSAEYVDKPGHQLVCMDILSLQKINDVYSREAGDILLKSLRDWVGKQHFPDSQLYRIDGDEFCLLLENAGLEQAQEAAQRIAARFEEPWTISLDGKDLQIFSGVTLGIIDMSQLLGSSDNLLNLMERTLDAARKTGEIVRYNEQVDEDFRRRLRMELSLKKCVKENMRGFQVFYQPIVGTLNGTWCGLEALCRWTSPEFGLVSPRDFIELAEQLGLIGAIDRWVLNRAVADCKKWELDTTPAFVLDVNLSPTQLTDEHLDEKVAEILARHDYPGQCLSLEITESAQLEFSGQTLQILERIQALGVQLALDDFGTGYASFNNLKNLPISLLKTDRSFIQNIEQDSYQQFLLYMMVELAHAADHKLIAEGVETEGQMQALLHSGADYLQGYLFSAPISSEAMENNLVRFSKPDSAFDAAGINKIDMAQLLDSQRDYCLTPRTYRILNRCMQVLFESVDLEQAVPKMLELLGTSLHLSQTLVILDDGADGIQARYEWRRPEIPSLLRGGKNHVRRADILEPIKILYRDGLFAISGVENYPSNISSVLSAMKVKSLAVLPMWEGKRITGAVALGDYRNNRDWLPDEILMLYDVSMILAGNLRQRGLQEQIEARGKVLEDVLNNIDMPVYVSSIEFDEILFANKKTREFFMQDGEKKGVSCWNMILNEQGRSPMCSIDRLLKNPGEEHCVREAMDWKTQRHFQIHGSVIPWDDGKRQAHLQYAMDITNIKDYQDRLRLHETIDVATYTLKRRVALQRMEVLLRNAAELHVPLSVCFVDIDYLTRINNKLGHEKGDEVVSVTAEALRELVSGEDLIGRFGGDEFILGFYGKTREEAAEAVEHVRRELEAYYEGNGFPTGFSFGVASLDEAPNHDLKQLLALAEQRMLDHKPSRRAMEERKPDKKEGSES